MQYLDLYIETFTQYSVHQFLIHNNLHRAFSVCSTFQKGKLGKNRFLSGIAQITSPTPHPLPPIRASCTTFFWTSKTIFLRVLQNQVMMITTMM